MIQTFEQREFDRICVLINYRPNPFCLFKHGNIITVEFDDCTLVKMKIQEGEYKWLKEDIFYPANKDYLSKLIKDKDYLSKTIKLDCSMPMIENCWFGADTTTILWTDGTKTTVKCQDGDSLDDEKGVLACIAKKAYGNTGKFNNYVSKAIEQGEDNFLKMYNRKMKKMAHLVSRWETR